MKEKKISCPVCEEKFSLEDDLIVGDTTGCPGCYIELEIIKLDPLRVVEVKDEIEDPDDGDYDDD